MSIFELWKALFSDVIFEVSNPEKVKSIKFLQFSKALTIEVISALLLEYIIIEFSEETSLNM